VGKEKVMELVNKVLRCLPWGEISSHTAEDIADHLIENDVVPVVRCRDCKFYESYIGDSYMCSKFLGVTIPSPNDFCSYGERKDNG
jgi:hypothetical protein